MDSFVSHLFFSMNFLSLNFAYFSLGFFVFILTSMSFIYIKLINSLTYFMYIFSQFYFCLIAAFLNVWCAGNPSTFSLNSFEIFGNNNKKDRAVVWEIREFERQNRQSELSFQPKANLQDFNPVLHTEMLRKPPPRFLDQFSK